MPSKSPAQHRLMEAVAHNPKFAKKVGIPTSVGKDFAAADEAKMKGGGLYANIAAKRQRIAERLAGVKNCLRIRARDLRQRAEQSTIARPDLISRHHSPKGAQGVIRSVPVWVRWRKRVRREAGLGPRCSVGIVRVGDLWHTAEQSAPRSSMFRS